MKIRIAQIEHHSHVDGPGDRTVLFLQGCPIHCPGCQNRHLWDLDGGHETEVGDAVTLVLEHGLPLTISGGEPFAQSEALALFLEMYRKAEPDQHVVIYSGFAYEDLDEMSQVMPEIVDVLAAANVLVDGPYIAELDHDRMQWRGSSNQRVIDLTESMHGNADYDHWWIEFGEPVFLDWNTPVLSITDAGEIVGAAGTMVDLFGEFGQVSRMCGQTAP